jgi:hypothetical protein
MNDEINWSGLPIKFTHLVPVFEKYGDIQFEGAIHSYLDAISIDEVLYLRQIFDQLLLCEDEINHWIDTVGITTSRAAALAYYTLSFFAIANDRNLFS